MALKIKQNAIYLIAALICAISTSAVSVSSASADYPSLLKLIAESEDVRMDATDLAFFLATHDYDAMPKDGCVIVKMDGAVYKLTPNGDQRGLADIVIVN